MNVLGQRIGQRYALYNGDSVEVLAGIPSDSVHFQMFSPPFESLYTYTNTDRDLGNCGDSETFWTHFRFIIAHEFRVCMPGRLVSIHCMQLPTSKVRDGYIGLRDFRGEIIRAYEAAGFIYHSEVCIWKDPVVAQQRTKALGLLHKQIVKDSAMSRQGIADYVVTMRKPGRNPEPVMACFDRYIGEGAEPDRSKYTTDYDPRNWYSIEVWQRYASPVWMDIDPSDTLQKSSAREDADERHVAPLQLPVIRRCVDLWSNPGDVVLSPFAGIGSEGVVALEMGRRFVGVELKRSYFDQAARNLEAVEAATSEPSLFPDEAA